MTTPPARRTKLLAAVVTAAALAGSMIACAENDTTTARRSMSSSSGGEGDDAGGGGGEEEKYVYDDGSGSGTTWSALYADLFGPSGRASCAGKGTSCHGSEDSDGAAVKFVCASESGCRESLLGESKLVQQEDFASPGGAVLVGVLRKKRSDGIITGTQPKSPLFVFHEDSIERIKTWIENGAQ